MNTFDHVLNTVCNTYQDKAEQCSNCTLTMEMYQVDKLPTMLITLQAGLNAEII
jgi:uncharacterized protein (DUF983 family)